jgi:hypothetical protein
MTTYEIYFYTELQWDRREFVADTPEQALELARLLAEENPENLDLDYRDPFDYPINEIVVCDEKQRHVAVWFDEDLRLRHAAQDLLGALETLAFEAERRAGVPKTYVAKARAAIAKAKGGAA